MQPTSWLYGSFVLLVLAGYLLPIGWRGRKALLLVSSWAFYALLVPGGLPLLVASTVTDYVVALQIAGTDAPRRRRGWLGLSLLINLSLLAAVKYSAAAWSTLAILLAPWVGPEAAASPAGGQFAAGPLLPLGISFYTFQTISYVVDVYRRRFPACRSLLDYALFLGFFPRLAAGPIVRADQFLPQLAAPRRPTPAQIGWGASLVVLGLFLKSALADAVFAPVAVKIYSPGVTATQLGTWVGTLAFLGQLYGDFAGYSCCAVGVGHCFGLVLPANFRFPFAAGGISDFWRRWHITLSTWLRDYLFLSLGGSWRGSAIAARNLLITMFLCGLWHGPQATFLVFGTLHGVYLSAEMLLRRTPLARQPFWQTFAGRAIVWAGGFLLLLASLVFFRAESLSQAFQVLATMAVGPRETVTAVIDDFDCLAVLLCLELIVVTHLFGGQGTVETLVARMSWPVWSVCLALMILACVMVQGAGYDFVYFRF